MRIEMQRLVLPLAFLTASWSATAAEQYVPPKSGPVASFRLFTQSADTTGANMTAIFFAVSASDCAAEPKSLGYLKQQKRDFDKPVALAAGTQLLIQVRFGHDRGFCRGRGRIGLLPEEGKAYRLLHRAGKETISCSKPADGEVPEECGTMGAISEVERAFCEFKVEQRVGSDWTVAPEPPPCSPAR